MYTVATMWVYTNQGRKVGEYAIVDFNDEQDYNEAFTEYCTENNLDPHNHNQCVGRVEELDEAITG